MSKDSKYEIFGAYNGKAIRSKVYSQSNILINATDLFRACKAPSKHRCDRFRNKKDIQEFLNEKAKKLKVEPFLNKQEKIVEVSGVIEIISGGVQNFQGTYMSLELAKLYLADISTDCLEWLSIMGKDIETEVIKARRVVITLGNIEINVFEIPTGEYRLSQIQVAKIVEAGETSFRDFLASKSPEALPYKSSRFVKIKTKDNNVQPKAIPIPVAVAYWTKESIKGNIIASRLLGACAVESIERRADKAFGKNVTEDERNQRWQQVYQSIIAELPPTFVDKKKNQIQLATFDGDSRKINKIYPQGIIPGFVSKKRITERLVLLSHYASPNPWQLIPGKELVQSGERKNKCPDFISNVIEVNEEKVVIIFQVFERIVDINGLRNCVNRNYSRLAKTQYQVDHSLLLLVSPLGMSKNATKFLWEEVEAGENQAYQKVGAITVKDLASFYYQLALDGKKNSKNISKIKESFAPFLNYQIKRNITENFQLLIPFASAS